MNGRTDAGMHGCTNGQPETNMVPQLLRFSDLLTLIFFGMLAETQLFIFRPYGFASKFVKDIKTYILLCVSMMQADLSQRRHKAFCCAPHLAKCLII